MSRKRLMQELENLTEYEDGKQEEDRYLYVTRTRIEGKDFDKGDVELQEHLLPITEKGKLKAVHVPSSKYTLTQHKDAFKKVLERLPPETTGKIYEHKARATMKLFPSGEEKGDIGLWVVNSVNSRAAVRVNFFEKINDSSFYIPKRALREIEGYKRVHRGE